MTETEITDPAFRAAHAYVIKFEGPLKEGEGDDPTIVPKIYVLAYKDDAIRPIEMGIVDPRILASGERKDLLAKFIRSKRADYPKCMVIYAAEMWFKTDIPQGDLHRIIEHGVSEEPDRKSGFMVAIYRSKEKLMVMHEILLNPKRLGLLRVADNYEGRFE